jgi:hypothetical protein
MSNIAGQPLASGRAGDNWAFSHRDFFDRELSRALQVAGIPRQRNRRWVNEFDRATRGERYDSAVVGGTVAQSGNQGGIITLDTTAVAGRSAELWSGEINMTSMRTRRWSASSRSQLLTANDNAGQILICGVFNSAANYCALHNFNGQLLLEFNQGGGLTSVVCSWALDLTAWHDFRVTFDLATATGWVDDQLVGRLQNTGAMPNLPANWFSRVANGATAASRSVVHDCAALSVEGL